MTFVGFDAGQARLEVAAEWVKRKQEPIVASGRLGLEGTSVACSVP
jgi:hypothetical protein